MNEKMAILEGKVKNVESKLKEIEKQFSINTETNLSNDSSVNMNSEMFLDNPNIIVSPYF